MLIGYFWLLLVKLTVEKSKNKSVETFSEM